MNNKYQHTPKEDSTHAGNVGASSGGGGTKNIPHFAAFTIIERPGRSKARFVRIGSAYINRDESLNLFLDAAPMNGKVHLRRISDQEGGKQ